MKERPILFSGAMVRAILDGRKTQTRRILKHKIPKNAEKEIGEDYVLARWQIRPPYWVGMKLWVREAFRYCEATDGYNDFYVQYRVDEKAIGWRDNAGRMNYPIDTRWRPSIHMPRWASRITLEVTDVRVERLHDICEEDARAEGITDGGCLVCGEHEPCGCTNPTPDARDSFINLWDSINAQRGYSWSSDPCVWVVAFKKI